MGQPPTSWPPSDAPIHQILTWVLEDQRRRWQGGTPKPAEEYLRRYPALANDREALLDVVYNEFLQREPRADAAEPEEYLRRFPNLAEGLRARFAVREVVERRLVDGQRLASTTGQDCPFPVPPQTISGYEMLGELGRGGMGVVYKARQLSCDRLVALKMILAGPADHFLLLARFRIEAEAIACLAHPNIVLIHDVGVHAGHPYFALEFAASGNLARKCRKQPQPPRCAAELVKLLALALHHAHERGILHRDLKPANILLMDDGTPKVTDFGLAKFSRPMHEVSNAYCTMPVSPLGAELLRLVQEFAKQCGSARSAESSFERFAAQSLCRQHLSRFGPDAEARGMSAVEQFVNQIKQQTGPAVPRERWLQWLTEDGAIMGTPQYMAPEQALGDNSEVGASADVYSLGAVLYELLTGHPPFGGETPCEVLERVISQPPRPIKPRIDSGLESICLKCLEKDPQRRYRSAAELADDLQRFLDGSRVLATPSGPLLAVPALGRRETLPNVSTSLWEKAPPECPGPSSRTPTPIPNAAWWVAGFAGLVVLCILGALLPRNGRPTGFRESLPKPLPQDKLRKLLEEMEKTKDLDPAVHGKLLQVEERDLVELYLRRKLDGMRRGPDADARELQRLERSLDYWLERKKRREE